MMLFLEIVAVMVLFYVGWENFAKQRQLSLWVTLSVLFVIIAIGMTALVCFAPAPNTGYGSECANKKVVVQEQVVATNFAVPVGIPVAPTSAYFYQATPQQVQTYTAPPPDPLEALLERKLDAILSRKSGALGLKPPTMVAQKCAKCHQDAHQDRPQFSSANDLDCATRLKAIKALTSGKMPPKSAGQLSVEERGLLIDEFSAVPDAGPKVNPNDVPPPPPNNP